MAYTIIGCVLAIVLYCIYDRRHTNKKADYAKERKRITDLEQQVTLQADRITAVESCVQELTEHLARLGMLWTPDKGEEK